MIGKVQDLVSAAVVIGAAEHAGRGSAASAAQGTSAADAMQSASALSAAASRLDRLAPEEGIQESRDAQNADAQQKPKEDDIPKMDEHSVSLMTKELNELMSRINCNLRFNYHQEVDVMSVAMVDKETQEVIKELPPEEMIQNMTKAKEWIGAFLDKNA